MTAPDTRPKMGLIAGDGQLPHLVARGMIADGFDVHAVGLRGYVDQSLADLCTSFKLVGMLQLGQWIRVLRRQRVSEAVMVGGVTKTYAHGARRWIQSLPDFHVLFMWYRTLRHDRRNGALLGAVADLLEKNGVRLIDSTTHIRDHMATAGTIGNIQPSTSQTADIEFGTRVLHQTVELDIGQSIAINELDVVAVEAIEGTARMIQRAGELCKAGWTLIKTSRQDHDMRSDVPTIGVETVKQVADAGGRCIAVGAKRVILLDRDAVIAAADRAKIALVGI